MAAYLLMPISFLRNVFDVALEHPVLVSEIADYFLVTEEFAQYRLELIYKQNIHALWSMKGKVGALSYFNQ